jgi:hypothetical protein
MPNSKNKNHTSTDVIVIGDVHNHIVAAETIAAKYEKDDVIIFVGDYFDDFHDNAGVATKTAQWLKESIQKPNRVHLLGNHDLHYSPLCQYRHGNNVMKFYRCSGYTAEKDEAINSVMTQADWMKLKLHANTNGWFITHAGIHPHWFEKPMTGMTPHEVEERLEACEQCYLSHEYNPIIGGAGRCRGGEHKAGGITWMDHQQEAIPCRGIFQIYGHTPSRGGVDPYADNGGNNICIDCGLQEILKISGTGGEVTTIKTGFDNFYSINNKNNTWD